MRSIFRYLRNRKFKYSPLVEVMISKENLLHNLNVFRKILGDVKVAPVLKSNAYGHDLILVAKILDKEKLPFFAVDSFHEALILRNEKIKTPLLVIGFTRIENILRKKLKKVAFTITSLDQLQKLSERLSRKTTFHLKIDTGIGRQGIHIHELDSALDLIKINPDIVIVGVASHLADADSLNEVYTKEQVTRWNEIAERIKVSFPNLVYYHLSNSAGYFYTSLIKANVARVGIGLYGIRPNAKRDKDLDLRPALEMKSIISAVKTYERGEKIGYNGTFEVNDTMSVATLPLGYFEGIDRRLSNSGFVKIKGVFCPIIGRVSLNITTVDVSKVKNPQLGDEVIIISNETGDKNSIENIIKTCDTTPYDILTRIPAQIRRTVV